MQREIIDLAGDLVAYQSISPDHDGSIDYIENGLTELGFLTIRLDQNDTSNLVARIGNSGPIFAFAGHVDVVPIGELNKWFFDPFTLTYKDGNLYGRGIADMKGAIASFMMASKKFLEKNPKFPGSLMFLITSDEETSGADGTPVIVKYLKEQKIKIDYCLLGEPTCVNHLGDVIKIGRRGSLNAYLEIIGTQGHIAYPHLLQNPIHMFAQALVQLSTLEFDNGNDYFPATSLQFSNLNSGLGVTNVVPGKLTATFNIRYNDMQTVEGMQKKVIAILEQNNLKYNISWNNSASPFFTGKKFLVKTVEESIKEVLKKSATLTTDGGTSDGRFLVDVCDELLEFGLTNKYIHHINENIPCGDLLSLKETYFTILSKIFRK
jgi:succinyl-diaminopimelate desuccinylase